MDMRSRNQYLKELRKDYLKTKSKQEKGRLLNEAEKRTGLERKYLIKKLRPKSNLDKRTEDRKKRKLYYDNYVKLALIKCWEIFDQPCGQRLESSLRDEIDRLRRLKEVRCSDKVAFKLKKISARTIDEKLKPHKEKTRNRRKYHQKNNPLLYQKIPVKMFDGFNRKELGNIQNDLVEHCGQSARGEYVCTLSNTDISNGWWEGEAVMGRGQENTLQGLKGARARFPFPWQEIHSDNGKEFINGHLYQYTQKEKLGFSRSRPYKKNDNCFVEQKNFTHVKRHVGWLRYDTKKEQHILNDLYRNELHHYKNFFQPIMKLKEKVRIGSKIHRKYEKAKTPYQRVMESKEVSEKTKKKLKAIYLSLNPAQLKRTIDAKVDLLVKVYQEKNNSQKVKIDKKLKPAMVSYFIAQPDAVSVS